MDFASGLSNHRHTLDDCFFNGKFPSMPMDFDLEFCFLHLVWLTNMTMVKITRRCAVWHLAANVSAQIHGGQVTGSVWFWERGNLDGMIDQPTRNSNLPSNILWKTAS